MPKLRQVLIGSAAVAAIALIPIAPAMAGGHGYGYRGPNPWGVGRGIVGAAVALATLPLAIVSAVVSGGQEVAGYPSQGYGPGYGYAPPVAYPGPQAYYAPRYYPTPGGYYGPRPYYPPNTGRYGHGYYRSGGNPYTRR